MILAILIAREMAFFGKNVHDLADALSVLAGKPVAILRTEAPEVPAFTIQPSEDTLFRQLLKVRSGYTSGLGWIGYFGQAFPDYMMRRSYRTGPDGTPKWVESDAVQVDVLKDERFKIKPGELGGSLVSDLVANVPGKWSVHWRYENAVVAFSASPMTVTEFASSLAEAVGATLIKREKDVELAFNPATFKLRFVAWLDKQIQLERRQDPNSYQCVNFQFAREAVQGAPMEVFKSAFDKPGSHGEYQIPRDSSLQRIAVRRIQAWVARTDVANAGPDARGNIADQIDWDRPVSVRINGGNTNVAIQAYKKGEPNHRIVF